MRALAQAQATVRAQVAPPLDDLLIAHLALRRGHLTEAEASARTFATRCPEDAVGRETLARVLRQLGLDSTR